jgi:dipeptidyl aminopeptidase/acylaminoacyl peptidase
VTFADLMAIKDLKGLYLSPDGRYAATLQNRPDPVRNTYDFRWVVVPLQGTGRAEPAGDGGEAGFFDERLHRDGTFGKVYATRAVWAPDGKVFAYLRRAGGEVQVWATRVADRRQLQLSHNPADVEDFVWSEDGRRLLLSTAAPRAAIRALAGRVEREGFLLTIDTPWAYRAQRPILDRYAPVGGKPVVWSLDVRTGVERRATTPEIAAFRRLVAKRDDPVAAAAGPAAVAMPLQDPAGVRFEPPRRLEVAGSDPRGCAPFGCAGRFDAVTVAGRPVRSWWLGRDLYLLRRQGANAPGVTLWRWPVGRAPAQPVLHSDDDLTDCSLTGGALLCLRQTLARPRAAVRVALDTGAISTVYDPNPQWASVRLGASRWVRFKDRTGHETYGVLTLPIGFRSGGRYPMVVIGYGVSDALRGDAAQRVPAQVLAARGFVTLVYHMWESEPEFYRPDHLVGMYGGDEPDGKVSYDQIADFVAGLARDGVVDPARVGIGGHSQALNTIAWGLTHGDLFKAVATGWIRWNTSDYFQPRNSFSALLEGADLLRDPARPPGKIQRDFSLSLNVEKVRSPILVNASGLELDVQMEWEALRRFADAGRPLEMHVAPDEDHVVSQPAHRLIEWRRNVQWFEYWLQDRREADAVDADQYRRWDAMKVQLVGLKASPPAGAPPEGG